MKRQLLLLRQGRSGGAKKVAHPELTQVIIRWTNPVRIRWTFPVEIRWNVDNPFGNATKQANLRWEIPVGIPRKRPPSSTTISEVPNFLACSLLAPRRPTPAPEVSNFLAVHRSVDSPIREARLTNVPNAAHVVRRVGEGGPGSHANLASVVDVSPGCSPTFSVSQPRPFGALSPGAAGVMCRGFGL